MKKIEEKLKEKIEQNKELEEEKLFCEYFKEWINLKDGCRNLKEYCPYRKQCLIYFYLKNKEV